MSPSFDITRLSLSDRQRSAVTTTEGALLVFAGAGSGKTRVITARIAYLIAAKKIPPEEILAVTFTNKAAREMRERAGKLIDDPALAKRVTICTFHALGLQILKREHARIGYPANFVIYSPYEQVELLKKVMEEERVSREQYSPHLLIGIISRLKSEPALRNDNRFFLGDIRKSAARRLFEPYQRALKAAAAMDFDDLLMKPLELLEENEEVRDRYAARWRYLMVDEYQDTNRAQYRLIRLLSSRHGNVCAVGDDDQSIYSWRGARVENILEFSEDFPGTRIVKMEENFRSVSEIVEAAGRLIAFNRTRAPKQVFARRRAEGDAAAVSVVYAIDEQEEAALAADEILRNRTAGIPYTSHAVIVRTNAQTLPFEKAFARSRIPYRVIGGQKFFENKEIKDLLAYLRVLVNPGDEISLRRIINYPTRGIGTAAIEKLFDIATVERSPATAVLARIDEYAILSPAQRGALNGFRTLFDDLSATLRSLDPVPFAERLIADIAIEAAVMKSSESDDAARIRIENIREFVSAVGYHRSEMPHAGPLEFWIDFINATALIQSADDEEKKGVSIITAHSAKGLEFDTVFLPGVYQGGLPNRLALEEGNIEEERRLCYVAFTRARRSLRISVPRMVKIRGKSEIVTPSVFLSEAALGGAASTEEERRNATIDILEKIQSKLRAEDGTDNKD